MSLWGSDPSACGKTGIKVVSDHGQQSVKKIEVCLGVTLSIII